MWVGFCDHWSASSKGGRVCGHGWAQLLHLAGRKMKLLLSQSKSLLSVETLLPLPWGVTDHHLGTISFTGIKKICVSYVFSQENVPMWSLLCFSSKWRNSPRSNLDQAKTMNIMLVSNCLPQRLWFNVGIHSHSCLFRIRIMKQRKEPRPHGDPGEKKALIGGTERNC